MTWAKIDDQLHAHRKAKLAWKRHPRALGLHLLALSYCAGHLTDGFVDVEFVEEKVPVARERTGVTTALVDAGLWTAVEGGWCIHDWLEYNPSRDDILEKRRADAERKARRLRPDSTKNPSGSRRESRRSPNGVPPESAEPRAGGPAGASRPDPTHIPLNPPPSGGRKRTVEAWKRTAVDWARDAGVDGSDLALLNALSQARPWNTTNETAADSFRGFVAEHFTSLTVEAPT